MEKKKILEPVTITIFGATGDLAQKKLFPALFHLFKNGFLKNKFQIVGFSRRAWSDLEFQRYVQEIFRSDTNKYDQKTVDTFISHLYYVSGDINDVNAYKNLQTKLFSLDELENSCLNKVFYLAVTPLHYEMTLRNISLAGLTIPCKQIKSQHQKNWTRVFVEKPFGNNLKEAQKLDKLLGALFDESQIFRIDHYLAKETLQNILNFRFANNIFDPVWNKKYIEKIAIRFIENNIVGKRGASYDPVGALRDVGQNHILQMLALITMENPYKFKSDVIRSEREAVLSKVHYQHKKKLLTLAQYKGYKNELGVNNKSKTETYFRVEVKLNNKRFENVPIILESGKGFKESKVEIIIYFKPIKNSLCFIDKTEEIKQNTLTFSIQPKEHISLHIFAKEPGFDNMVVSRKLDLNEQTEKDGPEAYERVLYDGLKGDNTLFTSTKEVLAEWKLITEILKHYKNTKLFSYPVGIDANNIDF